jgi:hypothetical protein
MALPPEPLDTRQFRRRLPLELTLEELTLLEHHQPRHGTKRATLIAGLQALTDPPNPEVLAKTEKQRDTAKAEALELRRQIAELEAAEAKADAKASKRADAATHTHTQTRAELAQTSKQLAKAHRDLTQARREGEEWQDAYEELDQRRVDGLRCPRCEQWAKPDEWALAETDDGYELVYHQPCGFHEKSFASPPTIMGYRRGR